MDPLWVDKHRPKALQKLSFHQEITDVLSILAQTSDFPHIILYGPEGSGKKTRAYAFLAKIFGDHVFKLKEEERILKPQNTSTQIEYSLFTSNYHIELTPSDNDQHDRHIVQNVVKQIAANNNVQKNGKGFKVLIINEADKLTKEAQGGLRRTMQKYMKNCRMILLCNNMHKIINPIRSRCLNIRVSAPSQAQISQILSQVAKSQSHNIGNFSFSSDIFGLIAASCQRNLRIALIQLQAARFAKNNEGILAPYKRQIKQLTELIIKEQSPAQLKRVREKLSELLVNCIDGQTIIKQMLQNVMNINGLRQQNLKNIIHIATDHQKTLLCGSKAILHLQSFSAHIMEQLMIAKNYKMSLQ